MNSLIYDSLDRFNPSMNSGHRWVKTIKIPSLWYNRVTFKLFRDKEKGKYTKIIDKFGTLKVRKTKSHRNFMHKPFKIMHILSLYKNCYKWASFWKKKIIHEFINHEINKWSYILYLRAFIIYSVLQKFTAHQKNCNFMCLKLR